MSTSPRGVEHGADWRVEWGRNVIVVEADDGCAGGAFLDEMEAVALRDALSRAIKEVWGPDDS